MQNIFKIWTDGSCKGNGQDSAVGAYAFLVLLNEQEIARGAEKVKNTTNNRMEMTAILSAIKFIERYAHNNFLDKNYKIEIYTDSAYCYNCYKQKWYNNWRANGWVNSKKEPVKNKDLWENLILYFNSPNFKLIKTEGHADDENNNIVDRLAHTAAREHLYVGEV